MAEESNNKRKSIIGTVLFYVLMFALLYFFGFRSRIPSSEEGVLISFGDTEMGSGTTQPKPVAQNNSASKSEPASKPTPPKPSVQENSGKEDIKTQEFDDEAPKVEAGKPKPEVKKPDPEEEKRKAEEAERLRKEQEETLRIQREKERKAAEEAARKQKILDELAQLDKEQSNNSNSSSSSDNPFSGQGNETSEGQGNTNFPGNSGSQSGDPNSNADAGKGLGKSGSGANLKGRTLSGSLPVPNTNAQDDGTVVIEIVVDRNGKVISANLILKGTTTTNSELIKAAKEAALKARFNSSATFPAKQTGTITYRFQLD